MAKKRSAKRSVRTPKKDGDRRGMNPRSRANLKPAWKAGEPSPNPSGRPKLLGESYKQWLGSINPQGITNAEAVARAMGLQALEGDVGAAREIRSATEGDKVRLETWQSELVEQVKAGALSAEDVIKELGEDGARSILIASGQVIVSRASEQAESGE